MLCFEQRQAQPAAASTRPKTARDRLNARARPAASSAAATSKKATPPEKAEEEEAKTPVQQVAAAVKASVEQAEAEAMQQQQQPTQQQPPQSSTAAQEQAGETWTVARWLSSLDVLRVLADGLLRPLLLLLNTSDTSATTTATGQQPPKPHPASAELAFMRALGKSASREAFAHLLDARLLDALADELWRGATSLASAAAATGAELHSKFLQEGDAFTLDFGELSTFYGGLESLIGAPRPHLREAMRREHNDSADSPNHFEALNYGTRTTPQIEFAFVTDADHAALRRLGLTEWPREADGRLPEERRRVAKPLSSFRSSLATLNARLSGELKSPPLSEDELIAARCYSGPMFQKYNAVLRGCKSKSSRMFAKFWASCKGNTYATTQHVIHSAICKMSQLTIATKVYRGVSGGVLPKEFWTPNQYNVRGGVEWAFLSCTADPRVAFEYAASQQGPSSGGGGGGGGANLVFEFHQGLVARGASLSWCSQYAFESEILFSPLTGLEVQGTRVEGSILVVSCALSVNLTNDATEKVVSRRQRLLMEMGRGMQAEVSDHSSTSSFSSSSSAALVSAAAATSSSSASAFPRASVERFGKLLREGPLGLAASRYNDDETFFLAVKAILELKHEMIRAVQVLQPHPQTAHVDLHGWSLREERSMETLLLWLQTEPSVRSLDLRNSEPTLRGAASLGAALRMHESMRSVTAPREAVLPVQQLSGREPLGHLNLSHRKLGAVAGCMLSELIAFNFSLTSLDLSFNMLGQRHDAAVVALSDALKACPPKLSAVKLNRNYVGLHGAVALAEALKVNLILTLVDLSQNEIGTEGLLAMREALERAAATSTPRTLKMRQNGVDLADAAVAKLRQQYGHGLLLVEL